MEEESQVSDISVSGLGGFASEEEETAEACGCCTWNCVLCGRPAVQKQRWKMETTTSGRRTGDEGSATKKAKVATTHCGVACPHAAIPITPSAMIIRSDRELEIKWKTSGLQVSINAVLSLTANRMLLAPGIST